MTDAQSTLGSARNTLGNIDALAEDGRSTAKALTKLSGQLDLMVAENREPIKSITTEGFGDIRRFVNEARLLVDSLSRVAARIEEDPSSVLFGSRDAQFKPQGK